MLSEEGYIYSSSVYPVKHDHYGIPDAPRFNYLGTTDIEKIPLNAFSIAGKDIPISGGGYFRLYPYLLTKLAIENFHGSEGMPYIFYLHPWEIDPNQPRIKGINLKTRFRHYLNLSRIEYRLERLLQDFNWGPIKQIYFEGIQ